jgi:hypothetical protein
MPPKPDTKTDVVHDDEYITIWYYPELAIIHHEVHKAMRGEPYRRAFLKGTEALQKHGTVKWLSDDRRHCILPQEDQEWATKVWLPATRNAGWKYWSIVLAENAVTGLYLRRFAAEWSAAGVTTELFVDVEPAMKWLCDVRSGSAPASQNRRVRA